MADKPNPVFNPVANQIGDTPFMGLLEPGNILNLYNRTVLKNPDGGWSTTFSKSFNIDGKETLIPTVVNGVKLSDQDAIAHFKQTGQHLGKFATPEAADYYANKLHSSQEAMGNFYGKTSKLMPETAKPARKRVPRK